MCSDTTAEIERWMGSASPKKLLDNGETEAESVDLIETLFMPHFTNYKNQWHGAAELPYTYPTDLCRFLFRERGRKNRKNKGRKKRNVEERGQNPNANVNVSGL